jgi:hypothetical protein
VFTLTAAEAGGDYDFHVAENGVMTGVTQSAECLRASQ